MRPLVIPINRRTQYPNLLPIHYYLLLTKARLCVLEFESFTRQNKTEHTENSMLCFMRKTT